jgi:hypothetical protein
VSARHRYHLLDDDAEQYTVPMTIRRAACREPRPPLPQRATEATEPLPARHRAYPGARLPQDADSPPAEPFPVTLFGDLHGPPSACCRIERARAGSGGRYLVTFGAFGPLTATTSPGDVADADPGGSADPGLLEREDDPPCPESPGRVVLSSELYV